MDFQYLKNIKAGMQVTILSTRKLYSTGIVEEIAARTPFHHEGIMVRLTNGDVGRVKKIILNELEQNEKNALAMTKILQGGETYHSEFKSRAFWSIDYSQDQINKSTSLEVREFGRRASKIIIAKSIAAFLNSGGGNLLVGVSEEKEKGQFRICGIEEDIRTLKQSGVDGYKRTIIDEIIRVFFPSHLYNHLQDYLEFRFAVIDGKMVCLIQIKKSDFRIFLKLHSQEIFIIRVESENRTLEGEKLVDYCLRHWPR